MRQISLLDPNIETPRHWNMKTPRQISYEKHEHSVRDILLEHENSETDLWWETWKIWARSLMRNMKTLWQISCWKHQNVRLENTGKCTKKPYYYYESRLYTITLQTNSKLAPGCWMFHQQLLHYRLKPLALHDSMLTITPKRQLLHKLHQNALHINTAVVVEIKSI